MLCRFSIKNFAKAVDVWAHSLRSFGARGAGVLQGTQHRCSSRLFPEKGSCLTRNYARRSEMRSEQQSYARDDEVFESVVKVSCTYSRPNFLQPWQCKPQRECSGSGFVIDAKHILTNAHIVADGIYIQVQRHGGSTQYKAVVSAWGHECDLALLTVQDTEFWSHPSDAKPLQLGEVPELQETVTVVGYPEGGSNLCVTQGIVSRVGTTRYAHSDTSMLAVQIDAAINSGNSGGPALIGDEVVGVAFQDLEGGENIGYIIPTPVVRMFLREALDGGGYGGVASLGITCQSLINVAMRNMVGMKQGQTGVRVAQVRKWSCCQGLLQEGDVLLTFDGTPLANDGTVAIRHGQRFSFDHLVSMKPPGSPARLGVMRAGSEFEVEVTLRPHVHHIPVHLYNTVLQYYVFGGVVFLPLSRPWLHQWEEEEEEEDEEEEGDHSAYIRHLEQAAMSKTLETEHHQIIIIAQVFADDSTVGYSQLEHSMLEHVDGSAVHSMRELVSAVEGGKGQYVTFGLDRNRVLVLDRQQAQKATPALLERHRIPSASSTDLTPYLKRH